eukprot:TRINITY_DN89785_c0_g1_i1.p1 TRINITY_DN89785_c0_g1~~TRINITY_DN89785_c0_g1_i1.p1  ORF type:complete len:243 (+),score=24.74 TRINITY_DN89785_c0_g1_i1:54-782(+)
MGFISLSCLLALSACLDALADDPYVALGPLKNLIGTWVGVVGKLKIPNGTRGPGCFYERQTFTPMWHTENQLTNDSAFVLRYEIQIHCPMGHPVHHEIGQWRWLPKRQMVVRSANIATGQAVVAAGNWRQGDAMRVSTEYAAPGVGLLDLNFGSSVSTTAFRSEYHIASDQNTLWYSDATTLHIAGNDFLHTAANCLGRMSDPLHMVLTPHQSAQCPGAKPDLFCAKSVFATSQRDDDIHVV